jgi:hypothetical protein
VDVVDRDTSIPSIPAKEGREGEGRTDGGRDGGRGEDRKDRKAQERIALHFEGSIVSLSPVLSEVSEVMQVRMMTDA